MAQTLVSLMVHVIFSTKHRADLIKPEIEPELFAYIGGIVKNHESRLLAIGGTANHVHLLISQSKNVALSALVAEIKRDSSKWLKTKGTMFRAFSWQDGYGAFSIGESNVQALKQYIARQKEKHREHQFEDEFLAFLKRYGVKYDERYLWD
jgi:REP element-mobilizing transposase RayT